MVTEKPMEVQVDNIISGLCRSTTSSMPASETVACILLLLLVAVPFQRGEVHARWTCLMQTWSPLTGDEHPVRR